MSPASVSASPEGHPPSSPSSDGDAAHRHQAGSTTHRAEDDWKHRAPYRIHRDPGDDDADANADADESSSSKPLPPVSWEGGCHCGRVRYELRRARPLASKYCHCTTCQRLHGAPFQWAAIFHKEDLHFTRGHHDLGWYDSGRRSQAHRLPCKVQCAYCRTPIMDEGRRMILLFPTLIDGINTPEGRKAFEAKCHMFYPQRVVDFRGDGRPKYSGLEKGSDVLDDDGNVVKKRKQEEEN